MSKYTEQLEATAAEIFNNGCTIADDACWTGRTAVRIILDDATEDGEEFLFFEFSDGEDGDLVWYSEVADPGSGHPQFSNSDMRDYFDPNNLS